MSCFFECFLDLGLQNSLVKPKTLKPCSLLSQVSDQACVRCRKPLLTAFNPPKKGRGLQFTLNPKP